MLLLLLVVVVVVRMAIKALVVVVRVAIKALSLCCGSEQSRTKCSGVEFTTQSKLTLREVGWVK